MKLKKTSIAILLITVISVILSISIFRPFNDEYYILYKPSDNTPASEFEIPYWQTYKINNHLTRYDHQKIVSQCINTNKYHEIESKQNVYNDFCFIIKATTVEYEKGEYDDFYYPHLTISEYQKIPKELPWISLLFVITMLLLSLYCVVRKSNTKCQKGVKCNC